jgi:hypothetical protein
MDADKFHANCFSFSGTVAAAHYMLRQKAYRVMWGGGYVVLDDAIARFSRKEALLGLSVYMDYEHIERNNKNLQEKDWYDKAKFIGDNNKLWKRMNVWDEALKYFDWEKTNSVKYNGYLVNHTQKLAVSLSDYYSKSMIQNKRREFMAIDLVPVLTETGGGTSMALFDGISADSTEELSATWCGDLLQIVDVPPEDYALINCCFADVWGRARFCYNLYGVDEDNYLLKNSNGNRFETAVLNFRDMRELPSYITVEVTEGGINYTQVPIEDKVLAQKVLEQGKLNTCSTA